jgi:SAM-dependent methyltransferase
MSAGVAAKLVSHYEGCFAEHGRTPKGVDWPNAVDLAKRFEVMLGVVRELAHVSLLDLGCGPGLLLDHIETRGERFLFDYTGADLAADMLESARQAWPEYAFEQRDILAKPYPSQSFDYVIMNGVLTEKRAATYEEMEEYALDLLTAAFATARKGIAFNVMSPVVDWERDDLFHWRMDAMAQAISKRLSRHMTIRADYGLYEYTVYVYREPNRCGM